MLYVYDSYDMSSAFCRAPPCVWFIMPVPQMKRKPQLSDPGVHVWPSPQQWLSP